jgi:8-oxo-dGTP pyrophosphatase MutT (NUDIX family)
VGEYRLLDSKEIARAGFLTLVEERFVDPEGEEFTRWAVRHPGAVVAVPVVDGPDAGRPEALLVRQYRPPVRRPLLELPAGKLDVPGEDPAEAMIRELAEEIQHRPGRLVKLAGFYNSPGFSTEFTHAYLALDLEPCDSPEPAKEEERGMTVERVALGDAARLVAEGEITDAKSIIGLLLAERYLSTGAGS